MNRIYLFIFVVLVFSQIGCDTIDQMDPMDKVTYTNDIEPLLTTCSNAYCHGVYHADGNTLDFDSTAEFASQPKFLAALKHEATYSPMPKGMDKLPDEDIALIEQWIEDGLLE